MPLLDHLLELRRRLRTALIAVAVSLVVAFVFFHPIFNFLTRPYCELPAIRRAASLSPNGRCQLFARGVVDPFKVRLSVSLLVGLIAAAPVWLYQLWAFVTPGLHRHERRWALLFVGSSSVLFALGATLAYRILPTTLNALLGFAGQDVTTLLDPLSYLSFLQKMVVVFGVGFEMPLLLVLLGAAGVVRGSTMLRYWRGVVFGITVFAGAAAPSPDVFTMAALAVPLIGLYLLAVGLVLLIDRRRDRRQAVQDAALAAELAGFDPPAAPADPDRLPTNTPQ